MRVACIVTALLMAASAAAETNRASPALAAWEAELAQSQSELARELIASGDAPSLRLAQILAPFDTSALRIEVEAALDALPITDAEGAWRAFHRCRAPAVDCDNAAALAALAELDADNAWTQMQLARAALREVQADAALQALRQAAEASPSAQFARDARLVEEASHLLPIPPLQASVAEEMGTGLGVTRAMTTDEFRLVWAMGALAGYAVPTYKTLTDLCRPDARQPFAPDWQAACLRLAVHMGRGDSSPIGGLIGFDLAQQLADDPAEAARWGEALRQERFAQHQLLRSQDLIAARPGESVRFVSEIFSLGERAAISALFDRLGLPSEAPPGWSADEAEPRG